MNLETLLAERTIYRNLVHFARAMDDRNWEGVSALLTPEVTAELGLGEIRGRQALVAFMASFLDDCGTTQHLLGNVLIEIDGDRATSQCYVSDMHLGKNTMSEQSFRTLGDYHDEWCKVESNWLICRRVKHNRATLGSYEVLGRAPD